MEQRRRPAPRKSTTVRIRPIAIRIARAALRLLGVVAPGAADALAARLFFTPPGGGARLEPIVAGLEARAFSVAAGPNELRAWEWGEGPAVLLVHGWGGHAGQLSSFASRLVTRGYRAIAFDMPAHGRSTGRQTTVLEMAEAVLAVGEAVGPVSAVVGHSLGATAAAVAISRGLRADRAVLLAPAAEPSYFVRRVAKFLGLPEERTAGMLDRVRARLGGDFAALAVPRLAVSLDQPALVVHDPDDRDVPVDHGRAIAGAWRGARLIEARGLGHHRILRDPDVIEAAVAFLAGRERRALRAAPGRGTAGVAGAGLRTA